MADTLPVIPAPGSSIIQLPLGNDVPWYNFNIILSGVLFNLDIRYNSRMSRWIMSINDPQGNPILESIPLLIGVNLIGRFTADASLPVGTFFVTDDTGQTTQPTRYSFGTDHTLWYYDPTGTT